MLNPLSYYTHCHVALQQIARSSDHRAGALQKGLMLIQEQTHILVYAHTSKKTIKKRSKEDQTNPKTQLFVKRKLF